MKIIHHFAIYNCDKNVETNVFAKHEDVIFPCFNLKHPLNFLANQCKQLFLTASVLSDEAITLPDDVGSTIDPDVPYFMLQAHLPNPIDQDLTISASVKLLLTSELPCLKFI